MATTLFMRRALLRAILTQKGRRRYAGWLPEGGRREGLRCGVGREDWGAVKGASRRARGRKNFGSFLPECALASTAACWALIMGQRLKPVPLAEFWPPFDPNFYPFGGFFFDIGLGGSHSSGFNYKGLEASERVDKSAWKA